MTKLEESKQKILSTIAEVEPFLSKEDFEEYCDSAYTCIACIDNLLKNEPK